MLRILPHRAFVEPRATIERASAHEGRALAVLRIEGLLCSACAANVRQRLERLPGVREARVDLDRGEAQVEYEAGALRPKQLLAAVEGAVVLRPARRLLARLSGHAR